MINYFFVYRPFHLQYVRRIIQLHHKTDKNIIVDHFGSSENFLDADSATEMYILPRNISGKVLFLRRIRKIIQRSVGQDDIVTFFIPHSLGVLSNYALFSLRRNCPNVQVAIFYEGVIFFKEYKHSINRNLFYYLSRQMSSLLTGIPYRIFEKVLRFDDQGIDKIYSPFSKINVPVKKLIVTELERIEFKPDFEACLILGHEITSGSKTRVDLISAMFEKVNELKIKKIYYKDHPTDDCSDFHLVSVNYGKKMELLERQKNVENLVSQYRPGIIISGWSSGLINLKCILPSEVKVYSFVNAEIIRKEGLEVMIEAFRDQQIDVVYV